MRTDKFVERHIGPNEEEVKKMLVKINANSIDELLDETIPANIRLNGQLDLDDGISEFEFAKHIQALGRKK
jgi:glycine dehydrogenase